MRHRLTSAIVIAAAALGTLAVPGAAQAASSPCLNGMRASLDGSGTLRILGAAALPSPVVYLRDKNTGVRVATVESFHDAAPESGTGARDLVSDPLRLEALGTYAIEVGPHAERVVCGDFDYRMAASISDAGTEGKVSLDNLTTTVRAYITVHDPRTGTSSAFGRGTVALEGEGSTQEGGTSSEGGLNDPFTFRGTETRTSVRIRVQATPEMFGAERTVYADFERRYGEIVLDPGSQKIKARHGEVVKIEGQAFRYASDGTRTPVPEGTPLTADQTGVPVTGADGRFERQVQVTRSVIHTGGPNDLYPWIEFRRVGTDVELFYATGFTDFKGTIDAARNVTFTGAFTRTPAGVVPVTIQVQYSADGKANWTTRGTFAMETTDRFQQTLAGETDGYWRLRYAAEGNLLGSVTKPVRLTRSETAFKTFDAAPEPVRKGRTLTLKGTLQHESPGWSPYAGQTVYFYFRPSGGKDFVYKGRSTTAADGTFVRTFTADRTGTWIARHRDADGKHFSAQSRQDDVVVKP